MMSDMTRLIDRYVHFEQRVRRWTERWCRPFCTVCPKVCCRFGFCIESRESAFLTRVAGRFAPRSAFSATRGWLSATGCCLVAGRPPVCYEFLCRDIWQTVAGDPNRRHALLTASMVVSYVGRRAIGGRHLVEALDADDLKRISTARVMTRLDEAGEAFRAAVRILDGRSADAGDLKALTRIASPPPTVAKR
jgi:hypothetical protein